MMFLKKGSIPSCKSKCNYWIIGTEAEEKKPRWSAMRNVLGWGIDKEEKDLEKPAAESKP